MLALQLCCNQNDILDYRSGTEFYNQKRSYANSHQVGGKSLEILNSLIYIKDGISQDRDFLLLQCHLWIWDEE